MTGLGGRTGSTKKAVFVSLSCMVWGAALGAVAGLGGATGGGTGLAAVTCRSRAGFSLGLVTRVTDFGGVVLAGKRTSGGAGLVDLGLAAFVKRMCLAESTGLGAAWAGLGELIGAAT